MGAGQQISGTVFVGKDIDKAGGMWTAVVSKTLLVRWRGVGDLQGDAFEELDAIVNTFIRFPELKTEC